MIIVTLSIICVLCIAFSSWITIKKAESDIGYRKTIQELVVLERNANERAKEMSERVKEVEDGVNQGFGVNIRKEITKIECIFTKLEMVIIMGGVYKLIETSGNIEDKEAYIKLYRKAELNVQQMEEEKE